MSEIRHMSDSSSDSDESFHYLESLKPYDFEPVVSDKDEGFTNTEKDSVPANREKTATRMGNIDWCLCGNCKIMET